MSKYIVAHALLVLLAGCSTLTPAERSVLMQKEVEEMIQVYGPACEKLGYQAETEPWRECILKLNTSKALEYYNARATTTQCFGHRGFFQCSTF